MTHPPGRSGRVLGVAVLLAVAAVSLWRAPVVRHGSATPDGPILRWWAVALLVAATEVVVLHVQARREGTAVSLGELAGVSGLIFATPDDMIAGYLVGTLLMSAYRRQAPLKIAFNLALACAGAGFAQLLFHSLRGPDVALDERAWLAAVFAMVAVAVLDTAAVWSAIALMEGGLQLREVIGELRSVPTSLGVSMVALVAAHALADNPHAVILVIGCALLLMAGYRRFTTLTEQHVTLERVHQVSRVLSSTPEVDELLRRMLHQIREVLKADRAEVVFLAADPGELPVRVQLDPSDRQRSDRLPAELAADPVWVRLAEGSGPMLIQRGTRDPAYRGFLESRGLRDAVAVPLHGEAGLVGLVTAGDRLGDFRSFEEEDVSVLQTIADQAGVALQRGELADRLRHDALHDALTGLPNRVLMHQRLVEGVGAVRLGQQSGLAVVVLDLSEFRAVNEVFGHAVADRVLTQIADRLAAAVLPGDVVARLGGDEFALILGQAPDPATALAEARRIRAELERGVDVDGVDIEVGTCLGVAVTPANGEDAELLMKRAEIALSAARRDGVAVQLYDPSLERPVNPVRLALLSELRHGMQEGQLAIHLQPQADLRTGEVVGAEALVRWLHPTRGMVPPDEFIPLAERSGLIRPLTTWVLAQALAECGRWRAAGRELSIAVNLSARSILDPDLVEGVQALLQLHRVPASALTLEITETSVLGDPVRTRAVLEQLHTLGVRLSIDDFGTGYSSLSYLRQLPVQEVKVDRSFVEVMLLHPEDETIVRSIVDLGTNLGLEVVAEGVEDAATWDRLAEIGCTLVQGYHLARPMSGPDFDRWLERYQARRNGAEAPAAAGPVVPVVPGPRPAAS